MGIIFFSLKKSQIKRSSLNLNVLVILQNFVLQKKQSDKIEMIYNEMPTFFFLFFWTPISKEPTVEIKGLKDGN